MSKRLIQSIALVLVLGLAGVPVWGEVIVAENLLVDLRTEDLVYGEGVATWPNRGSLGDFTANGSPIVQDVGGTKAVTFDGSSWFEGPAAPAGITGAGTRTMEVWAYNPSMPGEETMLSWSHRGGPNGSNMAFNYGNDTRWGSMGHWGGDTHDMGWWGAHTPAPAANTWWYLVYTYDGTAARVYVNGEQESVRDPIALDTYAGNIIRVAAQANNTGAGVAAQFNFTGSIAVVRIHDGVLSPAAVRNNFRLGRLKAWNPSPANGAVSADTWVSLSWSPGGLAASHDVYFSNNFADVNAGAATAFAGNQALTSFLAGLGLPGDPYPGGLVPGTTYYWRIDEVNSLHADSPWRGAVWSFLVPPRKAYNPTPQDGAKFVPLNGTLSWTAGFGAKLHTVHFGDNFDTVSNSTSGSARATTTYNPGPLESDKTYYWRVDEFNPPATHKGDVWSFTTIPVIPITDPNLAGWWKFDEGYGSLALDWSGHGRHATLFGNPAWAAGYDGGGLKLDGLDDYAALPIGALVGSLKSSTFVTWVNFSNAGGGWQRIFDFGTGTTANMFLTPRTGTTGPMRFSITIGGGGAAEEQATAPGTLPRGWHHVAVTMNAAMPANTLYLDGVVVAANTAATLTPSSLGNTTNNWLGRSQYAADAYFNGALDDFRIYDYALTAAEVLKTMRGDLLRAWNPSPNNGAKVDVERARQPLTWSPGDKASQHDVYFGIDKAAVSNAGVSDTTGVYRGRQSAASYSPPEVLAWGTGPYYWRIDEVNTDGTVTTGSIWSFSVADYLIVDDIESYNDLVETDPASNRIYKSWIDGFGTTTNGAVVGNLDVPLTERGNVHGDGQAMPLSYDNNLKFSEATLTLKAGNDWTRQGVVELSLWYRGLATNAAEKMYVALNGTAVVVHSDPNVAKTTAWTQWTIPLQTFAGLGVNLTNVTSITVGFGTRGNTTLPGGTGQMYFDDIRLYRPRITP